MLNLVGVIVAFTIIIFLIRKKFNFGLSLIIGSLVVGIFSLQEIDLIEIPKAFSKALIYDYDKQLFDFQTVELAILLTLIYILAKCMQETGAIKKLIDSLRTIFTKGETIGMIPAVYGLMPVPGGALFSAPAIDEEGNKYNLDKNQKNFLNIWFRHIWFPIYPISSAMILITSEKFSNIGIDTLILADIPVFIASIFIGYIILKRLTKNKPKQKNDVKKDYSGLIYLLPPILPVILYIILQFFGISQIRIFIIGVILSVILIFYMTDKTKKEYVDILKKSLTWKLALAIIGIMIFREVFEVSKANIVFKDIIAGSIFPTISMVVIIPLILGVITGYNFGSVALSYPILVPFFPANLNFITLVGLTSMIFMSSLLGYLISPIHLCNVLSSEYLKTDTTRMYRMLIPAALLVLVVHITFIVSIIFFFGV
jgi:integral membrane protein (TIGR00529 family)